LFPKTQRPEKPPSPEAGTTWPFGPTGPLPPSASLLACMRARLALLLSCPKMKNIKIIFLAKGYILRSNMQLIERALMSVSQSKPYPQSATKEKVDSKEAFANKTNLEDSIEYDVVVRMPPKKRYFVEIDVREITKAKPKIVLPEAI
jgi:hypothetical protein